MEELEDLSVYNGNNEHDMEVAFTFCLGKTKTATGHELYMWWGGCNVGLKML